MSCPKCHSHILWDDDLYWGCKTCGFMTNQESNIASKFDTMNGDFIFVDRFQIYGAMDRAAKQGLEWKKLSYEDKRDLIFRS